MSKYCFIAGCFFLLMGFTIQAQKTNFVLHFINKANGKNIVLVDSSYTNSNGETYLLTKLKYYISNIILQDGTQQTNNGTVYLIDNNVNNTIQINNVPTSLQTLQFQVGIDSALNCSGAQSGSLDPLNNMFWTWNSGYIMFKAEGYSNSSTAINNKIEYHIGGYMPNQQTMRHITIPINKAQLKITATATHVYIVMNFDAFWNSKNPINIATTPVIATPGATAVKAADNFLQMFTQIQGW